MVSGRNWNLLIKTLIGFSAFNFQPTDFLHLPSLFDLWLNMIGCLDSYTLLAGQRHAPHGVYLRLGLMHLLRHGEQQLQGVALTVKL